MILTLAHRVKVPLACFGFFDKFSSWTNIEARRLDRGDDMRES